MSKSTVYRYTTRTVVSSHYTVHVHLQYSIVVQMEQEIEIVGLLELRVVYLSRHEKSIGSGTETGTRTSTANLRHTKADQSRLA